MERKTPEEIAKIFKEVGGNNDSAEAGLEFDLGILLDKGIDKRDESTVEELKKFLDIHPELNYLAKRTLEKSISNRRDVDLLNYVSKVIEKLKDNSVSAEQIVNKEITNAKEKAKKKEIMQLVEKIEDEKSLEEAKNFIKQHPDLREMFVEVVLDQLIKSVDTENKVTQRGRLLEETWNFLVK